MTTALSLWAALADQGVPREHRGAASLAAMTFFDAQMRSQDAAFDEWRRQREAAFPHVQGEGPLADRCLCCSEAFPCAGYMRDIDNGEIPA